MKVSTYLYSEFKIELSGTYLPPIPERGPSYASGGEPAEAAGFEDVEVTGFKIERRGPFSPAGKRTAIEVDLLKGVALTPDVRALLDNIANALGEEAEEALFEEVEE